MTTESDRLLVQKIRANDPGAWDELFKRYHGRLSAYTFDATPDDELFIAFQDATSGRETYGAGRYLDLEPDEDGTYALDFNLAYHPSCVYSPNFSCPLTPAENRLPVRIEAGERLAEDATGD